MVIKKGVEKPDDFIPHSIMTIEVLEVMFPQRSIWIPLLKVLDETGGLLQPSEAVEWGTVFPGTERRGKKIQRPTSLARARRSLGAVRIAPICPMIK